MHANTRSHQLHGIFWPELFNHGMKLSAPCVWRSIAFLYRRSWRGRSLLLDVCPIAIFQQMDGPLHKGKALPAHGKTSVSVTLRWSTYQQGIIELDVIRWQFKDDTGVHLPFLKSPSSLEAFILKKWNKSQPSSRRLKNNDISLWFSFWAQTYIANVFILMMMIFIFLYAGFCFIHSSRL